MFVLGEMECDFAEWVSGLEPRVYAGDEARRLLDVVLRVKRLASAAETLLAARVAETDAWREGSTDRSAAHWLARRCGISIADAKAKLDTADKLAELPATAEALRAGRLSDQQAREVVAGATADPGAEKDLLATAADDSLKELRDESRRAQATDDEEGRQARIHRRRGLRARVDSDGEFCLTYRGTVYAGAQILAGLKPFTDAAFQQARKDGRHESLAAFAADGLLAMAQAAAAGNGTPGRSNVKVIIRVDATALRRGDVEPGEMCEIAGVGPVPVSVAREVLGDAALAVVITDGVDIRNVTHLKRRTTAHQRTALEFWGVRCDVKGCDSTDFVDVHHTFEWAQSQRTRLDELRTPCRFHHREEHKGRKPRRDQLRQRRRPAPQDRRADRQDDGLPLSA